MVSANRIIRIGRSRNADVVIADPSVSRAHAELIATDDGRFYLTDCGSTYGTQIEKEGAWTPVRQEFVEADARLLLGSYETCASDLVRSADTKHKLLQEDSEDAYRQSLLNRSTRPSPVEED